MSKSQRTAPQFCGPGELGIRLVGNTATIHFQAAPWMQRQELVMTIAQVKDLRDGLCQFFGPPDSAAIEEDEILCTCGTQWPDPPCDQCVYPEDR